MTHNERINTLKTLMAAQVKSIDELAEREEAMRRAVLDRTWEGLDTTVAAMKRLSEEAAQLENSRNAVYGELRKELGLRPTDGFYDFLARLDSGDRDELGDLYRRLRFAVGQVKSLTNGIDSYITATVSTVGKILEELFPSRRLKLYGRTGARRIPEQPMVVNHNL